MAKRLASLFICIVFLLPLLSPLITRAAQDPETLSYFDTLKESERYICKTLTEAEKTLYIALATVKEEGLFQQGSAALDLIEEGLIEKELLEEFQEEPSFLLSAFLGAKDAFRLNNPDLFYVDFSKVCLTVGEKGGEPHAYIGNGTYTDFFADGFSGEAAVKAAETELEAAISALLAPIDSSASKKDQTVAVNAALCETVAVSYGANPDGTLKENAPYIRTAYGALCKREAASDGIAAAFKLLAERLQIPTLLVSGYTVTPAGYAARTYNYVQLGGLYYAIDVTANSESPLHNACLLAGEDTVSSTYIVSVSLSNTQRPLAYPPLAAFAYGTPANTASTKPSYKRGDISIAAFSAPPRLFSTAFVVPTPFFGGSLLTGGWRDGTNQPLSNNRLCDLLLVSKRVGDGVIESLKAALLQREGVEEGELLSLSSYSLSLYLDTQAIAIPTGQSLTVGFPYPNGEAGPQKNTAYKAYYFPLDEDGQILTYGITEVPSVAIEGGVYATVQSSGLYAVAAYKSNAVADNDGRALFLFTDGCGTIKKDGEVLSGGIVLLQRGETLSLTLIPNEGYRTDAVLLDGHHHTPNGEGNITLSYYQMKEDSYLSVGFLSEAEKALWETLDFEAFPLSLTVYDPLGMAAYTLLTRNATPIVDSATSLYLDFSAEEIAHIPFVRYEWYKDGELLPEVTGTKLSFKNARLSDEGEYTVRITLENGFRTRVIESDAITLRVITVVDFFGWILVGLLLFAIPTFTLIITHLVRYVKKQKEIR